MKTENCKADPFNRGTGAGGRGRGRWGVGGDMIFIEKIHSSRVFFSGCVQA